MCGFRYYIFGFKCEAEHEGLVEDFITTTLREDKAIDFAKKHAETFIDEYAYYVIRLLGADIVHVKPSGEVIRCH